ncbi:hypothetical protein [Actinoplanes palleronii]|nr:hypothetical protein [Actinoplanes palleronii]
MIGFTDNHGQYQDGKFEITVKTYATYVANGLSKIVGPETITNTRGHDVPNLVLAFDCVIRDRG